MNKCGLCSMTVRTPEDWRRHLRIKHNPIEKETQFSDAVNNLRRAVESARTIVAKALTELREIREEHFNPDPATRRETPEGDSTGGQKGRGL